jgi:serine/threonine-protein kinase
MGEVYRARDTTLKRQVAIKILPLSLSSDPDRLARFQREAELLASMNHPNIATIYGVEAADGGKALVMELVEGQDLAQRLVGGAMPLDDVLSVARQIAEALEAAHEQGIVHRDLKPANIRVRADGVVKVLDFGLAKAVEISALESQNIADAPTLAGPPTRAGVVLGTAPYMSPEQARGKRVDRRADIWAFGTVVYEMLTGQRAFDGDNTSDVMAAVLRQEIDWTAVPAGTPPRLVALLRECLVRDPKQRLRDIGDARIVLDKILIGQGDDSVTSPQLTTTSSAAVGTRSMWRRAMPLALVATALAGTAAWWLTTQRQAATAPATRLLMDLRPADHLAGSTSVRPSRTALAISPDGDWVAFSAVRDNRTQLFMRELTESSARPVPGTEGGIAPFSSPDGAWIGFWADNKIKKISVAGGPVVTVVELPPPGLAYGATWTDSGSIVLGSGSGLVRVPSAGGPVTPVTAPDGSKNERHLLPHALPGGEAVLFTAVVGDAWDAARVVLLMLDSGEQRVLIDGGADARYVSSGHLAYMKSGTLMVVPFDRRSLRVTGEPVAWIEGVMQAVNAPNTDDETGAGQFVVSDAGILLYVTGGTHPLRESSLTWSDRAGMTQPVASATPRSYLYPRLSPDGQKIAVSVGGNALDVWVYDVVRNTPTRLTFGGRNEFPIWSPDGRRIVYASDAAGVSNLYAINSDGSGKPERLTSSPDGQAPSSWNPVTDSIAYTEDEDREYRQIWVLPMQGERTPKLFLESRYFLGYPEFSPDGRWLAYVSSESADAEVYVQPYPGPGEKHRVSESGGYEPIWSASGLELLFRTRKSDRTSLLASAITSSMTFRAGRPRLLFDTKAGEYRQNIPVRGWDMTADGKRLLLNRFVESADKPVSEFNVVLNWTGELKARLKR